MNQYNKSKLQAVMGKVDAIKEKIISGEIEVPNDDAKVEAWARANF